MYHIDTKPRKLNILLRYKLYSIIRLLIRYIRQLPLRAIYVSEPVEYLWLVLAAL